MLVSIDEFDSYSGNMEDDEKALALKTEILKAAQEQVSEYLRFDAEQYWENTAVPSIVRLTILRIATLMLMEAGENIGITGKSFADNSRTYIRYNDYKPYFKPLQTLRKVAF